jgi:hypothetical protein
MFVINESHFQFPTISNNIRHQNIVDWEAGFMNSTRVETTTLWNPKQLLV